MDNEAGVKYKSETQKAIEEGRNQVLDLLLALGDEEVAHDNWHPERAKVLMEARQKIARLLKNPMPDGKGVGNYPWPPRKTDGSRDWPDFENYSWRAG